MISYIFSVLNNKNNIIVRVLRRENEKIY